MRFPNASSGVSGESKMRGWVAIRVIATGAGAGARRSIGIAVFSGMIASTCLVVVFVPSFYVVMQRIEERRKHRTAGNTAAAAGVGKPAQ